MKKFVYINAILSDFTIIAVMAMSHTRLLLGEYIHPNLCSIIVSYTQSIKRDWYNIALAGEYETCMLCPSTELNSCLYGACTGGHLGLAGFIISLGANNFDWGLSSACHGGHLELAELMILHGADDFNGGLYCACDNGHLELAKLMISHGASDFNWGLSCACDGGHPELIKFMISHGATECDNCDKPIAEHSGSDSPS